MPSPAPTAARVLMAQHALCRTHCPSQLTFTSLGLARVLLIAASRLNPWSTWAPGAIPTGRMVGRQSRKTGCRPRSLSIHCCSQRLGSKSLLLGCRRHLRYGGKPRRQQRQLLHRETQPCQSRERAGEKGRPCPCPLPSYQRGHDDCIMNTCALRDSHMSRRARFARSDTVRNGRRRLKPRPRREKRNRSPLTSRWTVFIELSCSNKCISRDAVRPLTYLVLPSEGQPAARSRATAPEPPLPPAGWPPCERVKHPGARPPRREVEVFRPKESVLYRRTGRTER